MNNNDVTKALQDAIDEALESSIDFHQGTIDKYNQKFNKETSHLILHCVLTNLLSDNVRASLKKKPQIQKGLESACKKIDAVYVGAFFEGLE